MAGDEAAAGPDVDEEGARALWPVADTEDAAGPEADEEDASAAWLARDEASSGATCTLDLRRTTACRAMWSLRAGHTPVSRRICVHSAESPSPASWRKTRSYRAVDEPLRQDQSSTRGGEDQASRQPSLCKSLSSPTRRFKSPAKTQSCPLFLKLVRAAHVEKLALPRVSLHRSRARLGVRIQDGPAAPARCDQVAPVR